MARDLFHGVVRLALEKDGWTITDDPLYISSGGVDVEIDLGAERLIAAEKPGEKIAVEIKSFVSTSKISDFHTALGQFINYRTALRSEDPTRVLYLAVPLAIYNDFFYLRLIQTVVSENQLKIIVYNIENEEIVQWLK
ncbi:fatty-acid oxidation protein subunit alpha [Scytonema sp. UIC 10036]|uniref:element excision factor XisH family protein n=1 Tax=Scytonema sp. UIC 10036 TaxID=2304196 RepID=UPI0012DA7618|nr:element excision factor XisH family protein [Scytonema sp. UIC 10036]MUG99747.1 fatty-acid oxidation protein subunit alpha [Scytonema sp. UIC 10036]